MYSFENDFYSEKSQICPIKKRKMFTTQEDQILLNLVQKIGSKNWEKISKLMPGRSPKQCRDRYCNYLSEPIKKEAWNAEEDEVLLSLLMIIGPKWVEISKYLPGRSGSNVKNRWYKHLIKKYSFLNEEMNTLNFQRGNKKKIKNIHQEQLLVDQDIDQFLNADKSYNAQKSDDTQLISINDECKKEMNDGSVCHLSNLQNKSSENLIEFDEKKTGNEDCDKIIKDSLYKCCEDCDQSSRKYENVCMQYKISALLI